MFGWVELLYESKCNVKAEYDVCVTEGSFSTGSVCFLVDSRQTHTHKCVVVLMGVITELERILKRREEQTHSDSVTPPHSLLLLWHVYTCMCRPQLFMWAGWSQRAKWCFRKKGLTGQVAKVEKNDSSGEAGGGRTQEKESKRERGKRGQTEGRTRREVGRDGGSEWAKESAQFVKKRLVNQQQRPEKEAAECTTAEDTWTKCWGGEVFHSEDLDGMFLLKFIFMLN